MQSDTEWGGRWWNRERGRKRGIQERPRREKRERWITVWQVQWKSSGGSLERCGRRGVCAVWRSPAFGSYITLIQQEHTAQHSAMQSRQQTGRGENNVLRLHPLNLIETHSAEATFTHPPHAHFMNPLNLTFIFSLKNNKQPQGLFIIGREDCFC